MIEKTFGNELKNKQYNNRIGVYAIIFDNNKKLATVKTIKGNFLIGGGLEKSETNEACIQRECLEETGFEINIQGLLCKTYYYDYIHAFHCHTCMISYFYLGELKEQIQKPIEADHQFQWISVEDLADKMYLEHQIWAVKQAILSIKNR